MADRAFSDISYEQYLSEDKLMGSRCLKCASVFAPPRPICVDCHATGMEWTEMQGMGKLSAYTSITIGPGFMAEEGYSRDNPYVVGVVELDEGARVVARIEGVDAKNPENIEVGMALKVKFLHRGEGDRQRTFLAFEPA